MKRKESKTLVRLRRLIDMKPYEVGNVTKGANRRTFCVVKEDKMPVNFKAVAQALEGVPQLLTVMKSENLDASAQQKIETEIYAALGNLQQALNQPKDQGNFGEFVNGLRSVAEDLQAAGSDLAIVDRVAALGEKAAQLFPVEQSAQSSDNQQADSQATQNDQNQEAQASDQQTADSDQVAQETQASAETQTAATTDSQNEPTQASADQSATQASADQSATQADNGSTGAEATQEGGSETITKADLQSLLNGFADTVMKKVDEKLDETKKVIAQKSNVATTVPGTTNPTAAAKPKNSSEELFNTWDMSAALRKGKTPSKFGM